MITKNTITNIIGFIFMAAGVVAAFVIPTNTILIVITLAVVGIGLVFYKNVLFTKLMDKIK